MKLTRVYGRYIEEAIRALKKRKRLGCGDYIELTCDSMDKEYDIVLTVSARKKKQRGDK